MLRNRFAAGAGGGDGDGDSSGDSSDNDKPDKANISSVVHHSDRDDTLAHPSDTFVENTPEKDQQASKANIDEGELPDIVPPVVIAESDPEISSTDERCVSLNFTLKFESTFQLTFFFSNISSSFLSASVWLKTLVFHGTS